MSTGPATTPKTSPIPSLSSISLPTSTTTLRPGSGISLRTSSITLAPQGAGGALLRPGGGFASSTAPPSSSPSSSAASPSSSSAFGGQPGSSSSSSSFGVPSSSFPSAGGKRPAASHKLTKPKQVFSKELLLSFKSQPRCMQIPADIIKVDGLFCSEPYGPPDASTTGTAAKAKLASSPSPAAKKIREGEASSFSSSSSSVAKWASPTAESAITFFANEDERRQHEFQADVRRIQGLLNRLAETNYASVSTKILRVAQSTNVGLLAELSTHLFDKAISEPTYAPMWGNLCASLCPQPPAASPVLFDFRRDLLFRCQAEFDQSLVMARMEAERLAELATRPPLSEEEMFDEEERRYKQKARRLGTIMFIGELYLKALLAAVVVVMCCEQLMKTAADVRENTVVREICVELLSSLMNHVGSKLDRPERKSRLDPCFAMAQGLVDNKAAINNRTRFMLEALIKNRSRGFVNPKSVVSSASSASSPSAPSSPTPGRAATTTTTGAASAEPLSEKQQNSVTCMLQDYFASLGVEEIVGYIRQLDLQPSQFVPLAFLLITVTIQRAGQIAPAISLVKKLIVQNVLTAEHICAATASQLSTIDDIESDYGPQTAKTLLRFVAELFEHNIASREQIWASPLLGSLPATRLNDLIRQCQEN